MPNWWNARQPPRPRVTARIGDTVRPTLDLDSVLSFDVDISLDGEPLTPEEVDELLASRRGLALVRGKWVEADPESLSDLLHQWEQLQERADAEDIGFGEALRLMSEMEATAGGAGAADWDPDSRTNWSHVIAGDWLADRLQRLRSPELGAWLDALPGVRAEFRPYRKQGTAWLTSLQELGLGGCLADDMGLGKTLQILACLARNRIDDGTDLLVVPASLIDNWCQEIDRFVPSMREFVAHPSRVSAAELRALPVRRVESVDTVIATYGALSRYEWIQAHSWRCVVLDEAQAIKNPGTAQSRAARQLRAGWRVALTGTPTENSLGDLWSIFDFRNCGLLGSATEFGKACKVMADSRQGYAPLRRLAQPFLLRRLKTDRLVIADLPDTTEVNAWCALSRMQAALYAESVERMRSAIMEARGIERRGVVLAFLMRLKQICNHPAQWLGEAHYEPGDSGKFARLAEICDIIAARQAKVLVFTQFRTIIEPLSRYLATVFGREGLTLHGGTAVRRRLQRVRQFEEENRFPFLVISVKAGGVGLNLTAASHVIHFDRWWNPAVEDQATDRAFRIGQTNPVLVQKFVCRGTVEERVDAMIARKRQISGEILSGDASASLTEMSDEELFAMVSLDLRGALLDAA